MHFIFQIMLVLLCYDIHFYYFHRTLHSKSMYRYHKRHHEYTDNVVAMATFHASALENYASGLGVIYPYLIFDDVTFLAVTLGSALCTIKGIIRHDPQLVRLPVLNLLFDDHHIDHHRYFNCNYGSYWIDWLHGTQRKKPMLQG